MTEVTFINIQSTHAVLSCLQSFATQRKHFFTAWIHVPIGVLFLLFFAWALRLAINAAPFRFPAPVIAMLLIFFGLLGLDWLSQRYPSRKNSLDDQGTATHDEPRHMRRFVDPVMMLLAPPCEFCLRNMYDEVCPGERERYLAHSLHGSFSGQ